jgi:sugar-specific transcriptional regulator TrmB
LKSLLTELDNFGLNEYETKSYLALIGKSELTAVEVSKIAKIPRSRVYEILENLAQKGLCYSIPGPVTRYKGADPAILKNKIEDRLDKIKQEIKERENELAKLIKTSDEAIIALSDLFKNGRTNDSPLEYTETIKDPLLVHKKTCELTLNAKKELLAFARPPYTVPPEVIVEQDESEIELLKKGAIVRVICQIPKNNEEIASLIDVIARFEKYGEIAKVADELPLKLFIYDEETVMYSLEDPILHEISLTYTIVRHRSLAKFLKLAFEVIWNSAMEPAILKERLKKNQIITDTNN